MTTQGPFRSAERALLFSGGVHSCAASPPSWWWRIAAIWLVVALQKFLTFPRAHPSVQQPAALAAAGGEAIWFDIDGARVEAWFLPVSGDKPAPLLIHAHGNGELIDIQTQSVDAARAAGIAVLLVEYPGYGRSGGDPSEETVTATWVAAYDWAKGDARVDAARIVGYGRSLGGGAVAQLARSGRWRRWCWNPRSPASARWCARRASRAGSWSTNSTRARCLRSIQGRCSSCMALTIRLFLSRMLMLCVRHRHMRRCTCRSAATTIVRRNGSWYSVSSRRTA